MNDGPSPELKKAEKVSFLKTLGAVAWSFTGLRRKKDYERDASGLHPLYVVIAALLLGVAFIVTLVFVARYAAS